MDLTKSGVYPQLAILMEKTGIIHQVLGCFRYTIFRQTHIDNARLPVLLFQATSSFITTEGPGSGPKSPKIVVVLVIG
jgi:hypothetical protein